MRPTLPALASLLFLAGCRTAPPATALPPSGSGASESARPGAAEVVPVMMVEQQVLTEVPEGFDPTGRIRLGSSCAAWNDQGVYLGTVPEDRCRQWIHAPERTTDDRARSARWDGAVVRLEGAEVAGTLPCEGCAAVVDVAWSPRGDRVAVAREGAETVEIWSAARHERLSTLKHDPLGELVDVQLAWPGSLHVLLATLDDRPECDYEDGDMADGECIDEWEASGYDDGPTRFTLATHERLGSPPIEEPVVATDFFMFVAQARLDPRGRCIYISEFNASMRDELESRVTTQPLAGTCTIGDDDGMGDDDMGDDEPVIDGDLDGDVDDEAYDGVWRFASTEWLDEPRPRFLAMTSTADDEFTEGLEYAYYGLRITELGAERRSWSTELEDMELPLASTSDAWVEMTERELLAARPSGAGIETVWRHCFRLVTRRDGAGQPARGWCTPSRELPGRCDYLDMSPGGEGMLASCGRGDGALTLMVGVEPIDLGVVGTAAWAWGEGWLATVDDAGGVRVRSLATPRESTPVGPASAWVPTTLGSTLDRIVLHEGGRVRVLDALTRRELASVESRLGAAPRHAALSSAGDRLALTDGSRIETLDLDVGRSVKTWAAPGAAHLAWRQDAAIVFSGPDAQAPTAAWDAEQGSARPEALPGLEGGALDPTWRWVLLTPNRVMRMVDGQQLWFDARGALLDDGRFEGHPRALDGVMFRLGDDLLASPMMSPAAMRSVLEREGLARDFFAGRPIEQERLVVTLQQRDALLRSSAGPRTARAAG